MGSVALGRKLYSKAISVFSAKQDVREAVATMYLAMEECFACTEDAPKMCDKAELLASRLLHQPEDVALLSQLEHAKKGFTSQ